MISSLKNRVRKLENLKTEQSFRFFSYIPADETYEHFLNRVGLTEKEAQSNNVMVVSIIYE